MNDFGKFIRLFASDKPGEVIAAVAALDRKLEAAGLTFHDLADHVDRADIGAGKAAGSSLGSTSPPPPPRKPRPKPPRWFHLSHTEQLGVLHAIIMAGWAAPYDKERARDLAQRLVAAPGASLPKDQAAGFDRLLKLAWKNRVRP